MDLTPPSELGPCICGVRHNNKYMNQTLVGSYHAQPARWQRVFIWDSCPRHGGFEVYANYSEAHKALGKFYDDRRQDFQTKREWMWSHSGPRIGSEPPWEPVYYTPPTEDAPWRIDHYNPIKTDWDFTLRSTPIVDPSTDPDLERVSYRAGVVRA